MSSLVVQKPCGCVEVYPEEPYFCSLHPHMRSILSRGPEYTFCFKHSMQKRWPADCWREEPRPHIALDCGCKLYEHHNDFCPACTKVLHERDERRRAYKRAQKPEKIQWVYAKKITSE